jgi:hypothetical protein|tara:strand:- start:639 stop:1112 length:474 start_codon:yes stop_codon:yes gene_type:complete
MSQQGTRAFYQITEQIKTQLLADVNCNTVTFGNITDIDLSKQTIFPLSHIMVNNVSFPNNTINFNLTVLSMDIVDVSKEETTDIFRGNNNEHDVLNTQLEVQNRLIQELKRGDLFTSMYQVLGEPSTEPFTDRFENDIAGWAVTFDIITNNDISICD